jgi:hypothetical protein
VLQFVYTILMLVPLVALPVGMFALSLALGILGAGISLVLAIPVLLAASAHLDLLRVKRRFGFSDEELQEFARLVPRLARAPGVGGIRSREMKQAIQQAAADTIRERR